MNTKTLKVYCDVDGVVFPFFAFKEDYDNRLTDSECLITITDVFGNEREQKFLFNKKNIVKLSELSRKPFIDFVWLTSWRKNAPEILDELFNIESSGSLDWELKFSDYNQIFKRVAIIEDQLKNPMPFIWIDDIANRGESGLFGAESYYKSQAHDLIDPKYLIINTVSHEGLLESHFEKIDQWIKDNELDN